MRTNSLLKSPKKEEQLVPDSVIHEFFETDNDNPSDFKGNLGIKEEGVQGEGVMRCTYEELMSWDHLIEWDEFSMNEYQTSGFCDQDKAENEEGILFDFIGNIKGEVCALWEGDEEDEEKKRCLNLSLNYQEVIDAWSDRGSCRANEFTHSNDNGYMGEVPVMDEAKTKREASVLKYKKKRQNRLFSRKIRYQVRKLNADKRPRLKGRFVKRE
ncbi:zinc finger protein CONSTANS-LIKE 8-like [Bidens hawaiensis]|uniref:zinc finger protein CONSTANS-LIKE 8-like n=1 Tax=Bidens hawaiensis TaxID=980011 RepID=UPI00404B0058